MATAALAIVDRLIQLASVREKNKERFFNNFVEPLYIAGEQIAKDYMGLLAELIQRVQHADDCLGIVEWLEARRTTFKPVRDRVRALAQDESWEREDKRRGKSLALFSKGLWGLMKGGVSAVEDGHALTWEYGFGDHTVLDIIRLGRLSVLDEGSRRLLLRQAQGQQKAIEAAWKDVALAYADLRRAYLR